MSRYTFKTNDEYKDLNGDMRNESISLHINKDNEVNINVSYSVPNNVDKSKSQISGYRRGRRIKGYEVTEHIVCFCLMSMTTRDICNVEDEMNIYIPTNKNKNNCMQFITDFLKNEEVSNENNE